MSIYEDVSEIVNGGYETLYGLGASAFSTAQTALVTLSGITLPDAPTVTLPTFPELDIDFTLPEPPEDPDLEVEFDAITDPDAVTLPIFTSLPDAPEFTDLAPELDLSGAPTALSAVAPSAPAIDYTVDVPNAPAIASLTAPSLTTLNIPAAPILTVPTFTGLVPLAPASVPAVNFSYTENPYQLQTSAKDAIQSMLSGGAGFPPEVETALFDRARSREDITARKAVQEVTEEWSARGFSMPQGELNRRIDEVRQRNQDAVSTINRDIMVRIHEQKSENLRAAVQQGLVLEGQLIDLFNQSSARRMQAAELTARLTLEYFNAEVSLFNAKISGFNVKVELHRLKFQENDQKLNIYRSKLEAMRLVGDVNEQRIRIYSERVRAQELKIGIFKARIEAVRAKVDMKTAQVGLYRAEIEGFSAQVQAKSSEYQAWGEKVRAQNAKADIYKTSVSAYAERVRAYGSTIDATLKPIQTQMDGERLKLEGYQARLSAVRERISAKAQEIQTLGSVYDGKVRMYVAQSGAVSDTTRSAIAAYAAQTDSSRAQASVAIENARGISEGAARSASLAVEAQKGIAQVAGQLAVGTLSALNISATMGVSTSADYNYGLSVGYSVDGGEGEPPVIGGP
ncbi:MAG: hypothetical protein V4607_02020 [Pseudomonadota bacterium]